MADGFADGNTKGGLIISGREFSNLTLSFSKIGAVFTV